MSIEALTVFQQSKGLLASVRDGWTWFKNRDKHRAAKAELERFRSLRRKEGPGVYPLGDEDHPNFALYEWMADHRLLRRTTHGSYYLLPEDPLNEYT